MSSHTPADPNRKANRLLHEKSPYLLQHAYNPVDWYPWGDEAFAAARSANKPIFLSIGYSTCHWCHVMERESFESDAIAGIMNEGFINIKVDREEHPDVDQIYMAVVQRTTGQGGWPMSVFLTPELKPIFAGTYFPPRGAYGRPGFAELLIRVREAWKAQADDIRRHGDEVMEQILPPKTAPAAGKVESRDAIDRCVQQLDRSFDEHWGGFGGAPKFPRSMTLMLLMRDAIAHPERAERDRQMVEKTLEMMWRGGMYDHVGGAFARYSTDDRWLVPHFEKMLYDNALLVLAYTEAWQATKNPDWKLVVRDTLSWVIAEMTHPDGGFYSAKDADSEGEEGKFYVWSPAELEAALGKDDADLCARIYGVDEGGNFEGKSILYLPKTLEQTAAVCGFTREALLQKIGVIRCKLYGERAKRIPPGLDDKVLSSWNGLMIAAMARAGAVFGEEKWIAAAERAAAFVDRVLVKDGVLLRRFRDGDARLAGTLEDDAFLAFGRLELFHATFDPAHLERARELSDDAVKRFHDAEAGGFYFTEKDAPNLLVRMKEPYDGATPSGNSVMAWNLLTLAAVGERQADREIAEKAFTAFKDEMGRYAMAYPMLLLALDRALAAPREIVVVDGENTAAADGMVARVRETFLPHALLLRVTPKNRAALERSAPWIRNMRPVGGKSAAYVCVNRTCALPVTTADAMKLD